MEIDRSRWSGEGAFTQVLIDALREMPGIALLRVEDSPEARADAGYTFIANELFVVFDVRVRTERVRRLGLLPWRRRIREKSLTLPDLVARLAAIEGIGPPDYSDEGMIQYLRTERIVPPYQTRGHKVVELVRIYEAGTEPRRG